MFARGHTEQHMRVDRHGHGSATRRFEITDGLGLRDHSWGPRYWQNVWWYRWLTVNLGPDLGFALDHRRRRGGPSRRVHGFLYDRERHGDDRWVPDPRRDARARTTTTSGSRSKNRITVTTDDHTYEVEGDVWSNIPLRNRREGMVTRITEGMTRWRHGDLQGAGLSEYLDQIVDDTPVGTNVGI